MNLKSNFTIDGDSRSRSFFSKTTNNIHVSAQLIEDMKSIAFENRENVRVNLHTNSQAKFHDMIILQWKGTYIRPHKHIDKSETCHIIEGEQQIIILNENGRIMDNCNLNKSDNMIYRVDENTFHTAHIVSTFVIFHESKPGPFLHENDSIFPNWAPSTGEEEISEFMERVYVV